MQEAANKKTSWGEVADGELLNVVKGRNQKVSGHNDSKAQGLSTCHSICHHLMCLRWSLHFRRTPREPRHFSHDRKLGDGQRQMASKTLL